MRLFKATLLLTAQVSASAWHLQLPFQLTLNSWFDRPSHIPTFILDTQHPWVEQHRKQLERVPNASELLCNPDSMQVSTPGFPDPIPIPKDLFSSLNVDNNRAGISRLGWNNALHRLREIQSCPAALRTCESLTVDIFRHGGSEWDDKWEPATPPAELPGLFADVLSQMQKLKKLDWVRPSDSGKNSFQVGTTVAPFAEGFAKRNLTLPAVEHLLLGPGCESFVTMCPNLTTLETAGGLAWPRWGSWSNETDPYMALVRAAAGVNNISSFTMSTLSWRPELLEAVLESMPHIATLKIHGALDGHHPYSIEEDAEKLKTLLPLITRFSHLQHLSLPPVHELDVGFDGGAWCGNAYFGPEGREYARSVALQSLHATEKATNITLPYMPPTLKTLVIGETTVNLDPPADPGAEPFRCGADDHFVEGGRGVSARWTEKGADGYMTAEREICWRWTGRLDAYLSEDEMDV
ncbi:hypothetical protein B0H16DRAFT_1579647 [Mycena metata]|uniref:Uncharacterized protein n=1 Tax=Mycena metata TaxID=1033252 RepID=A0AAD7I3W0_9AGAR|nr:hypothetical protein B0H16DRAFT_1579647 [Mycena metata]